MNEAISKWEELKNQIDEDIVKAQKGNQAATTRVRVNLRRLQKEVYVPFRDATKPQA